MSCYSAKLAAMPVLTNKSKYMWLDELPGWQHLESLFTAQGYTIEIELCNETVILKGDKEIQYDDLPACLRGAFDQFSQQIQD